MDILTMKPLGGTGIVGCIWIASSMLYSAVASLVVQDYACFGQLLQIKCASEELIVFEAARYGRNDTHVAYQCGVPFQQTCSVDVNFSLNRLCSGRPACQLAVNTGLFGDPCGYDEFLIVTYRCVQVSSIHQSCESGGGRAHFDHGYLASPNYPGKYYMDAECVWPLSVQQRQTIRLTVFDFELDVRKGGQCADYLEVSAGDRTYFKDCGSLGKQEIEIASSEAVVRFRTGANSLTQRGFFVYFEAVGPGCPDHAHLSHGHVVYFLDDDLLYANATCLPGYHFRGSGGADFIQIRCSGSFWNIKLTECVVVPPPTTPIVLEPTNIGMGAPQDRRASVIGIILGVISAVLLLVLLFILALYFHRRRRSSERKLDLARVVINNLQDGDMADENFKNKNLTPADDDRSIATETAAYNLHKVTLPAAGSKRDNRVTNVYGSAGGRDPAGGRTLLPHYAVDDEHEYIMDYATTDCYRDYNGTMTTSLSKTPEHCGNGGPAYSYATPSRKPNTGKRGSRKAGQSRSQSTGLLLDDSERETPREKARPSRQRDSRPGRCDSKCGGQWQSAGARSLHYAPLPARVVSPPATRQEEALTQSAPDLTLDEEVVTVEKPGWGGCLPPPPPPPPRGPAGGTLSHHSCMLPPHSHYDHPPARQQATAAKPTGHARHALTSKW